MAALDQRDHRLVRLFPEKGYGFLGTADGREIYFYSNRAGSLGASDLWRSTRRSVHDPWSPPENLGAPLSTAANEVQPTLSYSGRTTADKVLVIVRGFKAP